MGLNLEEKISDLCFILDIKLMEMIWDNYKEDTLRTFFVYLKALYDNDDELGDAYTKRFNYMRRVFPEEF